MFAVSLAAIVLSLYYYYLWEPYVHFLIDCMCSFAAISVVINNSPALFSTQSYANGCERCMQPTLRYEIGDSCNRSELNCYFCVM